MTIEDLNEAYFDWLCSEILSREEVRRFHGALETLHSIPFYWIKWTDENRVGDALSFRQDDFLVYSTELHLVDPIDQGNWALATPSVLEILAACARRWGSYFDDISMHVFFQHMFANMGFHRYPGRTLTEQQKTEIRYACDIWMSYQFESDGRGTPFPTSLSHDVRDLDIHGQMNAYSYEHFQ